MLQKNFKSLHCNRINSYSLLLLLLLLLVLCYYYGHTNVLLLYLGKSLFAVSVQITIVFFLFSLHLVRPLRMVSTGGGGVAKERVFFIIFYYDIQKKNINKTKNLEINGFKPTQIMLLLL